MTELLKRFKDGKCGIHIKNTDEVDGLMKFFENHGITWSNGQNASEYDISNIGTDYIIFNDNGIRTSIFIKPKSSLMVIDFDVFVNHCEDIKNSMINSFAVSAYYIFIKRGFEPNYIKKIFESASKLCE